MSFLITFVGVCTDLWEDQPNAIEPSEWFGKRIVLANASDPAKIAGLNAFYGFNDPIAPHAAQLLVFADALPTIEGPLEFAYESPINISPVLVAQLQGVTITVNTTETVINKNARCIPQLGTFQPNVAPGLAATTSDPKLASAYFDMTGGTITGMALVVDGEAGVLVYTTATGPQPTLTITPFDPLLPPTTVTFSEGSTAYVTIANNPSKIDFKDNKNDFVLHYLAADAMPPQWPAPVPPFAELSIACGPHPDTDHIPGFPVLIPPEFGVGCSNSNIP